VLHVIRWRALFSIPDGDAAGCDSAHLQRLCGLVHSLFQRQARQVSDVCQAAKAQCLQSGVYVGPYSRWQFAGMQRM